MWKGLASLVSVHNAVGPAQAHDELLQLLSVTLQRENARAVLHRLAQDEADWTSCRVAESPTPLKGHAFAPCLLCLLASASAFAWVSQALLPRLFSSASAQSSAPRLRSASPPSLGLGLHLGQSSALRLHSASPPLGGVKPPLSHPDVAGMASGVYSPALGFASRFAFSALRPTSPVCW